MDSLRVATNFGSRPTFQLTNMRRKRSTAEVKVVDRNGKQIRLTLSCRADPKLFDQPLTLVTQDTCAWQKVKVNPGSEPC